MWNLITYSCKKGVPDIVEFLIEIDIDISIKYTEESINNMNSYEYAREFGQRKIAEYLMR
ncbi:hypothetical protein COF09_30575 [Bacillus toyonensis]|nr:hypothetical protein COF09_30575 [Bacillus toyonensis]